MFRHNDVTAYLITEQITVMEDPRFQSAVLVVFIKDICFKEISFNI